MTRGLWDVEFKGTFVASLGTVWVFRAVCDDVAFTAGWDVDSGWMHDRIESTRAGVNEGTEAARIVAEAMPALRRALVMALGGEG